MFHIAENESSNMKRCANAGSLLGQRRRPWTNSEPALAQRLVLDGKILSLELVTYLNKFVYILYKVLAYLLMN